MTSPPIEPSGRTRVLEVRRGVHHWEVKSLEANESAWCTSKIPLTVPEPTACQLIVDVFLHHNTIAEKVTIMVRNEPTRGILT